ncbi:hypothetical protein HNP48_005609 [Acidovorax soli]|uniref:Uncharacterized protein n=1 Tax=Acidovorax soli TaxID=592050 RepID=A0A7X0UC03_9BURK|nr:hypothetical protein [Acidovorax soli]
MAKTGRPPVISPGDYADLREVVRDNPQANLPGRPAAYWRRSTVGACTSLTLVAGCPTIVLATLWCQRGRNGGLWFGLAVEREPS